jgi:hypothetical protein
MVVGGNNVGAVLQRSRARFSPRKFGIPPQGNGVRWRTCQRAAQLPLDSRCCCLMGAFGPAAVACLAMPADDHQDAQVFTPPQLFNADGSAAPRPQILAAPDRIGPGVGLHGERHATACSTSALSGMSCAVTHSVNTDLRHVRFTHTNPSPGVYALTAPPQHQCAHYRATG